MTRYLGMRLADAIITLLLVLTVVFLALRVLPGDPAIAALGDMAGEEQIRAFREELGLNRPLYEQYFSFLWNMLQMDFGRSMSNNDVILDVLLTNLPYTMQLAAAAMTIGMLIGVPAGIVSAVNKGRTVDYLARIFALVGLCIPDFYLGALMLIVFALHLDWLPIMGGGGEFLDRLHHLVLPGCTLGLVMAAFTSRLTRSALLEVLGKDYVRTARAKGVSERLVITKHALRNALIPVVTGFGIYILTMLSGSISIELIFSRPGIGAVLVNGITGRDYTIVQAGLVMFAFFVVLVNVLVDVVYALIDPRIRIQGR
jgi:ABC-type dipeptide/oligopeptide/nickel transport system permease component